MALFFQDLLKIISHVSIIGFLLGIHLVAFVEITTYLQPSEQLPPRQMVTLKFVTLEKPVVTEIPLKKAPSPIKDRIKPVLVKKTEDKIRPVPVIRREEKIKSVAAKKIEENRKFYVKTSKLLNKPSILTAQTERPPQPRKQSVVKPKIKQNLVPKVKKPVNKSIQKIIPEKPRYYRAPVTEKAVVASVTPRFTSIQPDLAETAPIKNTILPVINKNTQLNENKSILQKQPEKIQKETGETRAPSYTGNPSKPVYPLISRQRGEEGVVHLQVIVSPEGKPISVSIAKSSGYARLDAAAVSQVNQWHFSPAKRNGQTVRGTVLVPIRFQLN